MTLRVVRPAGPAGSNRPPEVFLAVLDDGRVEAFNGHVDLGTGISTALTQIVADELDVALDAVTVVLGDTGRTPDQGPTIASETIQVAAWPLRRAAAQARGVLLARAADWLGVAEVSVEAGVVRAADGRTVGYGALVAGQAVDVVLADDVPVKTASAYRLVGQSVARLDIPAKAVGTFAFVHDLVVPGMLHGRVVRPPYLGHDSGDFVGRSLIGVDESSVAGVAGLVAVVTLGDFVGVVAEREECAEAAMALLRVQWRASRPVADLRDVDRALRVQPSTRRVVLAQGDVDAALQGAAVTLQRSYSWPYQMHASIGPSCAVADVQAGSVTVWSGTQNPHVLRDDLARLLGVAAESVDVVRMEASGCYGRNGADDVTGDAALLSRAVGRPVRVQLSRAQEHAWEPKGAAQVCDVSGGIDGVGGLAGYDFATRYPSNLAPMLALLLTGVVAPVAAPSQMGDRTAVPPYAYPAMRIVVEDMAPMLRASWMRGVSALPNSFAHECFMDELAAAAGEDPVAFRLRHLPDARGQALILAVAARAGWDGPRPVSEGDILRGRGFAYALYRHGAFPGTAAAWAAWVADVEVNRRTGEVALTRVTVGHDAGMMINPAGVTHQVHGNVIQSASRALLEAVRLDEGSLVASREWGGYPIMTFQGVPEIDTVLMHRPEEPALGAGESASVPSAAAIANAIFDATGVRFRSVPFTADVILAGLAPASSPPKRRWWLGVLGVLAAGVGMFGGASALPAVGVDGGFSAEQIARGRVLAGIGNCAGCHADADGRLVGGRGIRTPFGVVVATNITPDRETGIGAYSFEAFARAMRDGVARDGRQLYPAFPYTAYGRMTEGDLLALYAFVMAQPAVRAEVAPTRLGFPFGVRRLMAGWNALFHRTGVLEVDASQSAAWNRGRYLVMGPGHCGACHTPRNTLGAEISGAFLRGAMVDGWEAPALGAGSRAPVAWTRDALFDYLRAGRSDAHGVASGPMTQIVDALGAAPDGDVAAMAEYLASLMPASGVVPVPRVVAGDAGARMFEAACGACHHGGDGPPVFGGNIPLALNSSLHSDRPDNLVRVILEGLAAGPMPGFAETLGDAEIGLIAQHLRRGAGRPDWVDIPRTVARLRGGDGG